jgi:UDP-3-O-[3-hydroxymyristoyl] N-acetylglucosamine deacetylase
MLNEQPSARKDIDKMTPHPFQRTVSRTVTCSGTGLHSGKTVTLHIHAAPENHGITFVRSDLPDKPSTRAHFNRVVDTSLATVIGHNGFIVSTIEHLMATLYGLGVDNAIVELDSYEVPVMDGSARTFAQEITLTGVTELPAPRFFFVIKKPIEIAADGKSVGIYPDAEYRITYTIDYQTPLIGKQTFSTAVNAETFQKEIASARTFGFLHEVEQMKRFGLALGGSLDNAIVIDGETVLNDGGLRFSDEFVRHKILDAVGDFSLLGMPLLGHVVAIKSGHAFNHAFLQEFFKRKDAWETATLFDLESRRSEPANRLAI